MARDYVTLANLATGFLGEDDQIRSQDEDSKPARTLRAAWDEVRKFVIAQGEWNFAMRRASLAARLPTPTNPAPIGFTHAFPLPSDFRRFVEILEPRALRSNYAIEGGELLIDTVGPLKIRYVRDVPDMALWSDEFTEAFTMRLAWQVADRLTGDKQRKEQALAAYERAVRRGKGTDAKQNPPREIHEGDWIRARRGASDRLLRFGEH